MKHIVTFPLCNSLRFLPAEQSRNPLWNRQQFDKGFSYDLHQDDEQPDGYLQKWQMQDGIVFQISTNAQSVSGVEIRDCLGVITGSIAPFASITIPGNQLYGVGLTTHLFVLSPGMFQRVKAGANYYFRLLFGFSDGHQQEYVSEPQTFDYEHPGTVLLQYRNSYNKGDFIWEQFSARASLRVEGGIGNLKVGGKKVVADNGDFSPVLLSAYRWRTFELRMGNGSGVPDWIADKVDAIFDCDAVTVDGKAYGRDESAAVEIKGVEGTALRDASLKLRERFNGQGVRYNTQRAVLGTLPNYPFKIWQIQGQAKDFSGKTYSAGVSNVDVWSEKNLSEVLARLNGLFPAQQGDGGYFTVEGNKMVYQAADHLEIQQSGCVFQVGIMGGTLPPVDM